MKYPGIERATIEMAYDNGCVNRDRSEESLLLDLVSWLRDVDDEHGLDREALLGIDAWLTSLSEEDMHMLCAEEEREQQVVQAKAQELAAPCAILLLLIFEEVL